MQASVVIPVRNDAGRLQLCLEALAPQLVESNGDCEVIVVDNGSTDDLDAVKRAHPWVQWAEESRKGSYAARNHGVELARGEVILFTDSDCVPQPSWIAAMLSAVQQRDQRTILGGDVVLFPRNERQPSAAELWELQHGLRQASYIEHNGFALTANLAVPREALATVGEFDATLVSGGDAEWCSRATAGGWTLDFEPSAVVKHPCRTTLREIRKKRLRVRTGFAQRAIADNAPVLTRREAIRLLRPPLTGALRTARAAHRSSIRNAALYVSAVMFLYATSAFDRFRLAYLARKPERLLDDRAVLEAAHPSASATVR